MKASDVDILIVPGLGGSGSEHWQSRWASRLSTARRLEQDDWDNPDRDAWTVRLTETANAATRPLVLVAHSLGVAAVIRAVPALTPNVRGAFLVAPPDLSRPDLSPSSMAAFGPYARNVLPFPSITVASSNDPFATLEFSEDLAASWGSLFISAGEAGHINAEGGYGPWPEGSLAFAKLLQRL